MWIIPHILQKQSIKTKRIDTIGYQLADLSIYCLKLKGEFTMKLHFMIKFVTCIFVLSFSMQTYSQDHNHEESKSNDFSENEIKAINKVIDQVENGYEAGKIEVVMDAFADEAVLLEGRGINNGKKAMQDDHLGGEFKTMDFTVFRAKNRVIKGTGSIAYVYEILTLQMKRKTSETGRPARDIRALYILHKKSDGWKIVLWKN